MYKKKLLVIFIISTLAVCSLFVACNNDLPENEETIVVTDALGREVTVSNNIERVVCIGAGALRLYCYVGDVSKLVGVEDVDSDVTTAPNLGLRPYQIINAATFSSLETVGQGGPQHQSAEAEKIIATNPDLIISAYTSSADDMNTLQSQTGVPVVVVSYGNQEVFDQKLLDSITMLGKVLNKETRAKEITDYISSVKTDLNDRTKDIDDSDKKSVYLACQSNWGTQGFNSSAKNYSLFNATNVKNIMDDTSFTGTDMKNVDMEYITTKDPDIIIFDAGGFSKFITAYNTDSSVYDNLKAFKNGDIYLQMPYNAYYTNIDVALADAYYIGSIVFADQFDDIDISTKFDEIMNKMLNNTCYSSFSTKYYGGYQKIDLSDYVS